MGGFFRLSGHSVEAVALIGCGAIVLGVWVFADLFPRGTFFALPTAYYVAAVALVLAFRGRTNVGPVGPAAVSILFAGLLVCLGQALITGQGVPTRWLAWGRFAVGDWADFREKAVVLLQEGTFTSIRGRPLSSAFIAGLWRFTGFDLALLSIAMSALCALALYFFARVALTCFGMAGGAVAAAVAADFLHEHLGAASTEPIGFFVGTAGFALLFAAASNRSALLFSAGLGTLMLAFLMRAGALFIIPFLLLLPLFLSVSWKERFRWGAGALMACVVASVFHLAAVSNFTPDSPGFVNAPKSWYAIIAMGDEALGLRPPGSVRTEARWVQIFDDHPGLHEMPIKQQGARFIEIVTSAAMERPKSVLVGSYLEYKDQVLRAGLFRFIDNKPIRALAFAVFLAGFVVALVRARRDPVAALIALSCIGLFLSIPFLHGGENRVHIATAGLFAGTVGFAIAAARRLLPKRVRTDQYDAQPNNGIGAWVWGATCLPFIALAFVAFTAIGGAVVPNPPEPSASAEDACMGNARRELTAAGSGNVLTVAVPDPIGLGLHFGSVESFERARLEWLNHAAWDGLFIYAPIDPSAVRVGAPGQPIEPGFIFAAFLDDAAGAGQQADRPRTGLARAVKPEDLTGGTKYRCLEGP